MTYHMAPTVSNKNQENLRWRVGSRGRRCSLLTRQARVHLMLNVLICDCLVKYIFQGTFYTMKINILYSRQTFNGIALSMLMSKEFKKIVSVPRPIKLLVKLLRCPSEEHDLTMDLLNILVVPVQVEAGGQIHQHQRQPSMRHRRGAQQAYPGSVVEFQGKF